MSLEAIRLQIVQAGRILYEKGIVDAFGHVSCRSPERPDRFLMSRSKAPALVEIEDITEHNFEGEPVSHPGARVFLERFIHSEIYRARPDVTAVVHSHCQSVLPFTVVPQVPVRPVCHVCGFLADAKQPFDVADYAGHSSDLLIRDARLGSALASHLGDAKVVLMRGHGFTTVGQTVAEAVFRAVYTRVNCEIYMSASQLGAPRFLTDEEASACEETTLGQIGRVWELWVREFGDRPMRW
jgi:ribulose-5-phosphate 4-epimerase/fuculose-1-phosphate aldolase